MGGAADLRAPRGACGTSDDGARPRSSRGEPASPGRSLSCHAWRDRVPLNTTLMCAEQPNCATHTYIGAWGGFSSCLRGRAGYAVHHHHHHEGWKLWTSSVLVLGKLTTKLRIDCRRPAGAAPAVRAGRSEEKIARRKLHQSLGLGPAGLYQTDHMIFKGILLTHLDYKSFMDFREC